MPRRVPWGLLLKPRRPPQEQQQAGGAALENEMSYNEALIEERDQGITEIAQQIGEVNEIFQARAARGLALGPQRVARAGYPPRALACGARGLAGGSRESLACFSSAPVCARCAAYSVQPAPWPAVVLRVTAHACVQQWHPGDRMQTAPRWPTGPCAPALHNRKKLQACACLAE